MLFCKMLVSYLEILDILLVVTTRNCIYVMNQHARRCVFIIYIFIAYAYIYEYKLLIFYLYYILQLTK